MRILIVSSLYSPYILGGAEISTQILAEELVKRGIEVDVLTIGNKDNDEIINGVKVYRRNIDSETESILKGENFSTFKGKINHRWLTYYNTRAFRFYFNFFKTNTYDLIHCSNPMRGFYPQMCWKAANKVRIPIIQSIRDISLLMPYEGNSLIIKVYKKNLTKLNILYINKFVDCLHFPSTYVEKLFGRYNVQTKTKVIYNTVCGDFKSVSNKKNQIIYVGRIEKAKGINDLIESFKKLRRDDWNLLLIGNNNCGIKEGENIKIFSWMEIDKVYDEIAHSKILVLPSLENETFGRSIVEAVYNGTVAVARNKGAMGELLNFDERYVFDSQEEFQARLERIINLSKEDYIGEVEDCKLLMKKFSIQFHISNFIQLYSHLIKKNK